MKKLTDHLIEDIENSIQKAIQNKKTFTDRLRNCLDKYHDHAKSNETIIFDLRIDLNPTNFKGVDQFRLTAMKKSTCDILFRESGTLEEVINFAENYFKYPLKELVLDGHKYRLVEE